MSYEDGMCFRMLDCLPYFTRLLGITSAVVLWGIGFDMMYHKHSMGSYIISASAILLFLEITWAITMFLDVCIRNENNPILSCWSVVLWIDSWKKSLLYLTLATVLMVKPHRLWLTSLAGGMLIALGSLYFIQGIRSRYRTKELLLNQHEEPYDRFEEETESMNGEISNDVESESASTNEYIVQV